MAKRDERRGEPFDAGPSLRQSSEEVAPNEEPKRPVQEFRLGRIKAAVWENETQLGKRHSVTITRLFKLDGEKSWRTTTTFNRDDLPLVAKFADLAHTYIFGLVQNDALF